MRFKRLPIINRIYRRRLISGMHLLHEVLSDSPLCDRYWLCGGALLGYARNGGLIAYDSDVDFHYWQDDKDKFLASVPMLEAAGFKRRYYCTNTEGEVTMYKLANKKGVGFDFFAAHKVDGNTRWWHYGRKILKKSTPTLALCETPGCELETFEFYGKQWLKPKNHEEYLGALYGDWRTPKPDYCWARDSKAIIQRIALSGKYSW